MDLFDAIYTTRAMRRLAVEPVPDELISQLLDAAIRAPSASNQQTWAFVVVTDEERRARLADIYRDSMQQLQRRYASAPPAAADDGFMRVIRSSMYLAEHLQEAPVHLIACARRDDALPGLAMGASVYPAVQNLLLAARALGLGATLTTMHLYMETAVAELLELPSDFVTAALIPIGWPRGTFGLAERRPIEAVTHRDRWGTSWTVPVPPETAQLVERLRPDDC